MEIRNVPVLRAGLNGPHREEHQGWLRSDIGLAFERVDRDETIFRVEIRCVRLRIDDDADAAVLIRHPDSEIEYESEDTGAESEAARRLVDGETGQPEHGERISRELLTCRNREAFDLEMTRSDRREAEDLALFDGHIGHTYMVLELVLAGKPVEEAVEIGFAGSEMRTIVTLPKRPNLHRASGRAADWSAYRSLSARG